MSEKNLITRIKETYNKAGFVGALGVSTLMIPVYSFLQNVVRGHGDWESIKSRILGTLITLTVAPPVFKFIDWSSEKLKIKKHGLSQYLYSIVLAGALTFTLKGTANISSMYKTSSLSKIIYTTLIETGVAMLIMPTSLYMKDLANDLIGNYKFEKIPKWIKEKTQKQKRRLAYAAVGLSMLVTSAIYVATPSKEPNEVINKRPETENVTIKYAQTQNLYK